MRLGVSSAVVESVLVEGDVEIAEGRIVGVGLTGGSGSKIAVPGFIDVHTHGYRGVDFARATESEMSRASTALPETGVTGFQPTLITMAVDEMVEAAAIHASAGYPGSRFLGTHLEGPFLSQDHPGAHQPDLLLSPDTEVVQRLLEGGDVGQVTMAPELPGASSIIRELAAAGTVVSLGHSNASADEATSGFDAGASAITHVFNASRPLRHRDPGIIGVALVRDGVYVTAVVDGVHLSREVAIVTARTAGRRLVAITDAMAAAGSGDGDYLLGNLSVRVSGGEARLEDGTIASSVLTMDAAFRNLVELGLTLTEAAIATAGAPARMVGHPEMGSLKPGSVADVVVLDGDLTVDKTFVGGYEVFSS